MPDRSHPPAQSRRETSKRSLANESRLLALGDAVDRRSGVVRKRRRPRSRKKLLGLIAAGVAVVLVVVLGGGYVYGYIKFGDIKKDAIKNLVPRISGQPFNILVIGSDSRAGLKGHAAAQAGSVSGQRSDAIKIVHVDPGKQTISMISIPRDTLVTMEKNQSLFGQYNRINTNYGQGPSLLVKTIEDNFGIPISHVIQVSFNGLINAADTLGGVYLNFPYPVRDEYSGLHIKYAGCHRIHGFKTLAFVRSRHYQYLDHGQWIYDPTSDFGRIQRQDTFMRALLDAAKGKYNPVTINNFVTALSHGIILDTTFNYNELLGLAYDYKDFNSSKMRSYTLPVGILNNYYEPGPGGNVGDVLYEDEPYAQKLLVRIFGSELTTPKTPPPAPLSNGSVVPIVVPHIVVHPTTTTSTSATHKHKPTTTPTTLVPAGYDSWNPTPCGPGT